MAAGRKLQAEIDKVLKKVEEGIEEFNTVWDNVHGATHANQREKFEAELKTQIKKLQRDREQIKTWQSDKNIKDKNVLAEARRKIELDMERFKEFERDAKTKQYSKEGLSKGDKVDPEEELRIKHREWIQSAIDKLQVQVDEIEAEHEAAAAQTSGKKKNSKKDAEAHKDPHLAFVQETHRWHATKLEQLLRKVDNSEVKFDDLEELRDSVEYYVDENSRSPDEFQPFDEIYETFALEDIEDYLAKDKDKRDSEAGDRSEPAGDLDSTSVVSGEEKVGKKEKHEDEVKAPSKSTKADKGGLPASPSVSTRQTKKAEAAEDPSAAQSAQKPWPPMVSVWQNPVGPPKSSQAPVSRPGPSLPPPSQPAPDRPPPPGQAPVLSTQQPPPKPAPHQPPQMPPPMQAPPQPPLPSPPLGSPPRPQPPPGGPGTLAGIVGSTPMPPPPSMAPPAPQDGLPGAGASPSPQATVAQASLSDIPTSAPPPPPPPLLPPPPPSPAPVQGSPPASSPSLPAHAKVPTADLEPPSWAPPPPPVEDRTQPAPKMPPPSEAPPPPSESPPLPPLDGYPVGLVFEGGGSGALLEGALAPASLSAISPAIQLPQIAQLSQLSQAASSFEDGVGLPVGGLAGSASDVCTRPAEGTGHSTTPESGGALSSLKLNALQQLAASHQHLPLPCDSRRNRKYVPRNPYAHLDTRGNAAYATQPTRNYDDPAMFEKYDLDTLFFIFYYQQGSYQQHLAAKELKKLSWRYHTKYLTWFQRHEEPRMTAAEFERGAYVYFDHDSGWCQRIKSEFTFEYQFLEDEPM